MNSREIKNFVQQTLGCECPEEIFRHIECQLSIPADDIRPAVRINIGNRLLIYVVEIDSEKRVERILPRLINTGKKERDDLGFNRFRLVLACGNIDEIKRTAEELFGNIDRDEKIHLHVVQKADVPV
jgi:hypothetical protein